MKMFHYLYKITHIKTGRIYIGIHSTNDLEDRYFANGVYEASETSDSDWIKLNHSERANQGHIKYALRKYGRESFEREIIQWCNSREELILLEEQVVTKEFIDRVDTFNQRTGGYANTEFSEEVRKRISKNNPMHREEVRIKVSQAQKKIWNEEKRRQFSSKNPMKNREIAEKLSGENSVWFGKKHSQITKEKISNANKGKKQSKETTSRKSDSQSATIRNSVEIYDNKTGNTFNSLNDLRQYLRDKENIKKGIGGLSEILRGLRPNDRLHGRIIYSKNRYEAKSAARLFLRGDIWQVRIWIKEERRYFKKSLGTKDRHEAEKLAEIEFKKFHK